MHPDQRFRASRSDRRPTIPFFVLAALIPFFGCLAQPSAAPEPPAVPAAETEPTSPTFGWNTANMPGRSGIDAVRAAWPDLPDESAKQQIIKAWRLDVLLPDRHLKTRFHPHQFEFMAFALKERHPQTSKWVLDYLTAYAWREFGPQDKATPEAIDAALEWLHANLGRDPRLVTEESMRQWIATVATAPDPTDAFNILEQTWARQPLIGEPVLIDAAREAGLEAALLRAFEFPAASFDAIEKGYYLLAQIDGETYPNHPDNADLFMEAYQPRLIAQQEAEQQALMASLDISIADGDERKRWVVHPPIAHENADQPPEAGWGLLVVVPGGAGGPDFAPFVRDTIRREAGDQFVVVQMIAPPGVTPTSIVWPTATLPDERVGFFMEPVITEATRRARDNYPIDPERIFILGWSSGGPVAYRMTMAEGSPFRGAVVIMSVFKPHLLPEGGAGRSFYILHSPEDFIEMAYPQAAATQLSAAGARVTLETYDGGHGWQGDSISHISKATRWLEEQP